MGVPDDAEPDVIDLINEVTGDEALTRKILEHLVEHKHLVVSLRSDDIKAAAFAVSTILEGVPPTAFMAALAEQGAYVVMRPRLRSDLVSQSDGTLLSTHPADRCLGNYCVLHNPSDHPLKEAPIAWDEYRMRTDRICPHGQHHPDPDHLAHVMNTKGLLHWLTQKNHTCDGCCKAEPTGTVADFLRKDPA